MSPKAQEKISSEHEENFVYGVFEPVDESLGLPLIVAYKDVAFLYLHLRESVYLPHYFVTSGAEQSYYIIQQLILAGILEVEYDNAFVSGPSATKIIIENNLVGYLLKPGLLPYLSMRAIEYAMLLEGVEGYSLVAKLYAFNTVGYTFRENDAFASSGAVEDLLFNGAPPELRDSLDDLWTFSNSPDNGWLTWSRQSTAAEFDQRRNRFTFKLYISPQVKDFPKVFQKSIPVLMASKAFSFKVGTGAAGVFRPDKMVAYFEDEESLRDTAQALEKEISKFSAQGVPFTKQFDTRGLLSGGVDPADGGSWRMMLTNQLAKAIIQAKTDRLNIQDTMDFIRVKLYLQGIDINEWVPNEHFFGGI